MQAQEFCSSHSCIHAVTVLCHRYKLEFWPPCGVVFFSLFTCVAEYFLEINQDHPHTSSTSIIIEITKLFVRQLSSSSYPFSCAKIFSTALLNIFSPCASLYDGHEVHTAMEKQEIAVLCILIHTFL